MGAHQDIYKYLSPLLVGLLLSTGFGLIIGLEREFNKLLKNSVARTRTYPIISFVMVIVGLSIINNIHLNIKKNRA